MFRAIGISIFTLGLAFISHSETKVTYKFAKSSSSYYQMAVQIAENTQKITNGSINPTIEESQGSVQNVIESRIRPTNYIFSSPPGLIKKAISGEKPFKEDKRYSDIRGLFVLPPLVMHFVLNANTNVDNFSELTNQSILVGKGSFGAREAKRLLNLFNANDVKLINAELSSATAAFKNNKIDGFVSASSWPSPAVTEVSATQKINLITMSDDELKKSKGARAIIPAGTYKGVDTDIQSSSLPVGVYTTSKMSNDTAYTITKSFWESKTAMSETSPWWNGISTDSIKTLAASLHPGAIRYYKEIGLNL